MMRLLYLYAEEFTGERAREVHTINRVHSLARAGVEVTLALGVSPQFSSTEALLRHFNLAPTPNLQLKFFPRRISLGPWNPLSSSHFYKKIQQWLENENVCFDCAYVIHLKAARFLEASRLKIPYIFEAHEIFADSYDRKNKNAVKLTILERDVYQNAQAIVATSNFLVKELQSRYPTPPLVQVIPNSVEDGFFNLSLEGPDPKRLIYIGSFQHWKGVDVACEAMKQLPDFSLDVIGGRKEQIEALSAKAPANIHFHGFKTHEDFFPILEKAAIALVPNRLTPKSSLYSFPMKLLEYAAAGKLVVASDLPVLRELAPGPWCRLAPSENPALLAEAIRNSIPTGELQSEARKWAAAFTWTSQAEALKTFLQEAIGV